MDDVVYLVDNNVLAGLSRAKRAARLLRESCFVTADVVHEARGFADEIRDVPVRAVTSAVLEKLRLVMERVDPHDTSLVDLYANKGSADPVLMATALVMVDEEASRLWQRRVVVVTDDRAVIAMAGTFGVPAMRRSDFAQLLG